MPKPTIDGTRKVEKKNVLSGDAKPEKSMKRTSPRKAENKPPTKTVASVREKEGGAGEKERELGKSSIQPSKAKEHTVESKPSSSSATKSKSKTSQPTPQTVSSVPPRKTTSKPVKVVRRSPPPDLDEESEREADGKEADESEGETEGEEEEEVHIFGFSSDGEDSSDDEEDMTGDEEPGVDVKKLPTIAKDDTTVKKKLEKAKRKPAKDAGVIYLGRIPHGFYEDQMKSYFRQFGDISRLRLSRNKKTGHSKHYAFIEFESSSVAQIVAETMDNYLLMGHILTCKVIPKNKVHPELWIGANRKWRKVPHDRIARVEHNKPRTEEEQIKAEERLLERQEEKKRKLAKAGIDYNFEAVAYKKRKPTEA